MRLKTILTMLAFTAVSVFAQPRAFIENSAFDWGSSPEGSDIISHTFVIENRGTDTLRITNVRSSCGCTVGEHDSVIAPSRTGNVVVKFNKTGRTGQQSSTVTIFTNDTETPQIRLSMRGHIRTPLEVSPRWMNLFSDRGVVRGTVSFITENNNLQITGGQYALSNVAGVVSSPLTLRLTNKSAPDNFGNITYQYEFSFQRNVDRHESGSITFESNMSERPSVSINVSVEPSRNAPY